MCLHLELPAETLADRGSRHDAADLPDDALDERFEGAAVVEQLYGVKLTSLDSFIETRVAQSRPGERLASEQQGAGVR